MRYSLAENEDICLPEFLRSFVYYRHILSLSSNVVYLIALYLLLCKYPEFFKEYQRLLLYHLLVNWIFEIYINEIFNVYVVVPWFGVCSYGYLAKYKSILLIVLVLIVAFTGVTIIELFESRYMAVTIDKKCWSFKFIVYLRKTNYILYTSSILSFAMAYNDMEYQDDYYEHLEKTQGPLPLYVSCTNCFIFNYSVPAIIIAFITGCLSIIFSLGFVCISAILAYSSIRNGHNMSKKLASMQRNFLLSLSIQVFVHVTFLVTPFLFFVSALFIDFPVDIATNVTKFLVAITSQHGSVATGTMLITVDLLKNKIKRHVLLILQTVGRTSRKITNSSVIHVGKMENTIYSDFQNANNTP